MLPSALGHLPDGEGFTGLLLTPVGLQIFCIPHDPRVAAYANDSHFLTIRETSGALEHLERTSLCFNLVATGPEPSLTLLSR